MVWSLEEEEGKERRGGIRGGRGRQAGGKMVKEENAMRKWGEEEDKHAEDLAGSEEGTAGSFYNIRWISKFSDSSPHRLMDLPDGSHQRDHTQTTAGPGGCVHVYFTFEIKKRQKKKQGCFLRRQFTGSTAPAAAPSPPCLSTLTPAASLPMSPAHLHSLVQNLVHMRQRHPTSQTCFIVAENGVILEARYTIRPARWALSGMWAAEIMCLHICAFPLPPFIVRGSAKLKWVTFGPPGWDAGRSLRSGTHGTTHHGHLRIEWQKEHIAMVPHKPTSTS